MLKAKNQRGKFSDASKGEKRWQEAPGQQLPDGREVGAGKAEPEPGASPKGLRYRKALGKSPEETWPRGAAPKDPSHAWASVGEGFL